MKTLITSVVLAATLSVLLTSQAQAAPFDPRPTGALKDQLKINTKINADAAKATPLPTDKFVLLGGLEIKSFGAHRDGNKIVLNGVVSNTSLKALDFSFKIWKWTGASWTLIQDAGSRRIASKESMNVPLQLPATNDGLSFKLQVHGGNHQSLFKQCKLAARLVNFVVRYGTNGDWVLVREYHNDLSDGFDASILARDQLKPLGLETQIRKKKTTGIDTWFSSGSSTYTAISVRTAVQLERTFEDRNEAEQFRQTLISQVKDKRLTVESVREQAR